MPSNVHALDASVLFGTGLNTFVALIGPSGWGKTHLLEAASSVLSHKAPMPVPIALATEWLSNPGRFDPAGPLLLDDVQDAVSTARTRLLFRLALERRVRAGRRTLIAYTAPRVTRQVKSNLPYPHDWILATISDPQPSERVPIIARLCETEGLSISPALARLIANRMNGNGCTLVGALKRLRLAGSAWTDLSSTFKACGLLDPFFADNSSWDFKDHVMKAVSSLGPAFSELDRQDLAIYTMLHEGSLAESDVARRFRIEPHAAYQRALAVRDRCKDSELASQGVRQIVETVVDNLLRD